MRTHKVRKRKKKVVHHHKKKRMTRKEWEEFLRNLVDTILEDVDYWCWNISGDTVTDCYSTHANSDLWELANNFASPYGGTYGITEEDVKKLEEAPEDLYDKYNHILQERLEKAAEKLCKKYGC